MKILTVILLLLLVVSSCTSTQYYQLYKTSSSNLKESQGNLFYEDNNVKIYYNLWSENGNPGFIFYNKTDSIITFNKDMSFYIQNGFSYDYFQNRKYTMSSNYTNLNSQTLTNSNTSTNGSTFSTLNGRSTSGISSMFNSMSINTTLNATSTGEQRTISKTQSNTTNQGTSISKGVSITIEEPSKIKIAPNSGKLITEFSIVNSRYKNCDFGKAPTLKFTEDDSPLHFSNIISYQIGEKVETIENTFFVNEISNLSFDQFHTWKYDTICGKRDNFGKIVPKLTNPNYFFIEFQY